MYIYIVFYYFSLLFRKGVNMDYTYENLKGMSKIELNRIASKLCISTTYWPKGKLIDRILTVQSNLRGYKIIRGK